MKYSSIICLVLGAALGSSGTYIFLKKKYDRQLQDEIDDVKKVYSKVTEAHIKVEDDTYSTGKVIKGESTIMTSPYTSSITTVPTTLYIPKEGPDEDDITEYREKELGMLHPGEDPDFPYLISDDTYVDTKENYAKNVLHYYAGDQVIADDELEAIIHPETLVGDNVPEYFDNLLETEHYADAIYIRNDNISQDFEIIYHEDSFFCE